MGADVKLQERTRHAAAPVTQAAVSGFVMVRNEEQCLRACLDALAWTDEIVVLDSFSTDRTCEIAASYPNVRLVQRHFTTFGDQRDFGLNALSYRNAWVLVVDADEIVSPALAAEVVATVRDEQAAGRDMYYLRRTPWFGDRPLRHNLTAQFWIPRLIRPGRVRVIGRVHEQMIGGRGAGYLANPLDHHQFCKGLDHWRERRRYYTVLEGHAQAAGELALAPLGDVFSHNPQRRRAVIKQAYLRLPFRGLLYFLVNLVAFSAWRDGWRGLQYITLEASSQRGAARAVNRGLPC